MLEPIIDVIRVEALEDYRLFLEFRNGEQRVLDMSPYMDQQPFARLKAPALFSLAAIENGTVVWPGEIDVAPQSLYRLSKPV